MALSATQGHRAVLSRLGLVRPVTVEDDCSAVG